MKRWYQIASAAMMLIAALLIWQALNLRYYTPLGPGPGFFPFWLSIVLAILSAVMIWQATFGRPEAIPPGFYPDHRGYFRICAVLGALIGMIILMKALGFVLSMLLFYVFLLRALGHQSLLMTAIIAVAGSFGVYYIFANVLGVPLPIGILGF